jgi:hypothetical protein
MIATEMSAREMAALLAEQARRIAALESQLASRTAAAPARVTARDEGVRIFNPPEPCGTMPSGAELQRLLQMVITAYPALRLPDPINGLRRDEEERDHLLGFKATFHWLSHVGRSDELDHKHALTFWIDEALEWCRARQVASGAIRTRNFLAACVARADVRFTDLARLPYVT